MSARRTENRGRPLGTQTAKEIVAGFSRWHVHGPAAGDVVGAIGIHQRAGISFRDAMIVRSAAEMGCTTLYSEDLSAGQEYSGVGAENPFRPPGVGRAQQTPAGVPRNPRAAGRGMPPTAPGRYTRRGQRAVAQLG